MSVHLCIRQKVSLGHWEGGDGAADRCCTSLVACGIEGRTGTRYPTCLGKFGTSLAGGSLLPHAFQCGRGTRMHAVPWHAQSSVLPSACRCLNSAGGSTSPRAIALLRARPSEAFLCASTPGCLLLCSDDQKSALRGWQSRTPSLGWHLHLKGGMPVSGTLLFHNLLLSSLLAASSQCLTWGSILCSRQPASGLKPALIVLSWGVLGSHRTLAQIAVLGGRL